MHLFHFLSVFWLNGISLWQCGGMRYGLQQDDLGIIILLIVQNPPSPLLAPHFPLSHRQPAKNQACYYVIHTQWFPHYIATLFKLYYGWMNDCDGLLCTFDHLVAGAVTVTWCSPDVGLPERHVRVDHLVVVVPRLRVPHKGPEDNLD